jgi:hypothetical protein
MNDLVIAVLWRPRRDLNKFPHRFRSFQNFQLCGITTSGQAAKLDKYPHVYMVIQRFSNGRKERS